MYRYILTLLITLLAMPAASEIISVTATPSRIVLGEDGRANIRIRYTLRIRPEGGSGVDSYFSELYQNGNGLLTLGGTIFLPVPAGDGIVTRRATETVTIDDGLVADLLGVAPRGEIVRTFTHAGSSKTVRIPVKISGANASGTTDVQNLSVFFDDRSRIKQVAPGARVTAQAVLSVRGRGVITGRWLINEPGRGGTFRTLKQVRKPYAGSRRVVINSPVLPTRRPGTYRLRFAPDLLTEVTVLEDVATVRYTVQPQGGAGASGGLSAQGPGAATALTLASRFSWTPTKGAAGYQLEFVTQPSSRIGGGASRVAAVSMPSSRRDTTLKPFTLARIANAGGQVYWRVVALDGRGRALAVSDYQPLGGVR